MSRKETVIVARHIKENEEIDRIINSYANLGIYINKLEASQVLAMRSIDLFWSEKKAKEAISRIRGIL